MHILVHGLAYSCWPTPSNRVARSNGIRTKNRRMIKVEWEIGVCMVRWLLREPQLRLSDSWEVVVRSRAQ
jgi:hypothetical protein